MYLRITNRCNMSCAHCGMNCTAKGEDMTSRVYKQAIKYASETLESIALGGGEPTLHKRFWEIIGLSIASCDNVWLATNGSQTNISIKLAHMAKRGIIGCALSQDEYHDPIDPRVIQAFTRDKRNYGFNYNGGSENDYREIRDVTGKEIKAGRCEEGPAVPRHASRKRGRTRRVATERRGADPADGTAGAGARGRGRGEPAGQPGRRTDGEPGAQPVGCDHRAALEQRSGGHSVRPRAGRCRGHPVRDEPARRAGGQDPQQLPQGRCRWLDDDRASGLLAGLHGVAGPEQPP